MGVRILLDSSQSQFKCSSCESRKSEEKTPTGADMSKGLTPSVGTDRVRSSQSILSMLLLCKFKAEGDVPSLKSTSMETTGECSASISFRVCVSVWAQSVLSRRVSSWVSEVSAAKLAEGFSCAEGSWATWTTGGGRDKTVLMGRVVTLAVTGRGLSRLGGSCLMKGEISEKQVQKVQCENFMFLWYAPKKKSCSISHHHSRLVHQTGHPSVG